MHCQPNNEKLLGGVSSDGLSTPNRSVVMIMEDCGKAQPSLGSTMQEVLNSKRGKLRQSTASKWVAVGTVISPCSQGWMCSDQLSQVPAGALSPQ